MHLTGAAGVVSLVRTPLASSSESLVRPVHSFNEKPGPADLGREAR